MRRNSSKEQYQEDAKVIEHCETIQKNLHVEKSAALLQSQWTVIIVASTRLLFELFQMFMVSFHFFNIFHRQYCAVCDDGICEKNSFGLD